MAQKYESALARDEEDDEDELDDTSRNEGMTEEQIFGGGMYKQP